jgi:metal-sulfur cluster biosynthetic enzyme
LFDDPDAAPVTFDATIFEDIFGLTEIEPVTLMEPTMTTIEMTTTTVSGLLGGGGF